MGPYIEKPGAVRRRASYAIGHNARIKTYPDGSQDVLVCEAPIFGFGGWEAERGTTLKPRSAQGAARQGDPQRAIHRAKAQVRDIALCTPFRWFVTLTLSPEKVKDRHDPAEVTRHLNHWLDNQVRRRGLCYVLVPERHKDGAIHFHGFFNDVLEAADSGTIIRADGGRPRRPRGAAQAAQWLAEGGHRVYNLPGWGWGFTAAIELYGTYSKAVGYVCKYIGKDTAAGKIGGRWYYSGGKLGRPEVSYGDMPMEGLAQEEGAFRFAVKEAGLGFVMKRYEGGTDDGEKHDGPGENAVYRGGVPQFGLLPDGPEAGLRGVPRQPHEGHGRGGEPSWGLEGGQLTFSGMSDGGGRPWAVPHSGLSGGKMPPKK